MLPTLLPWPLFIAGAGSCHLLTLCTVWELYFQGCGDIDLFVYLQLMNDWIRRSASLADARSLETAPVDSSRGKKGLCGA